MTKNRKKSKVWIFILIGIFAFIFAVIYIFWKQIISFFTSENNDSQSADNWAIRNKNPGNIKYNKANEWEGAVRPYDKSKSGFFEVFESDLMGFRALIILLRTYIQKKGLTTIYGIISTWHPPYDDDFNVNQEAKLFAYLAYVEKITGIGRTDIITFNKDFILKMAYAISSMEAGKKYSKRLIKEAWELI